MAQSLRNALHLSGRDIRNPAFYDPRHFGYSLDHCCPSNPVPFGNPAVRTLHRSSHTSLVLCYWSVYLFTDPCCRRFYPDMQFVSSLCHFILYSKIERDSLGRLPCSASLVIAHHGRSEHSWPSTVTPRLSQSSKWFIDWLKNTQINLCVVLAYLPLWHRGELRRIYVIGFVHHTLSTSLHTPRRIWLKLSAVQYTSLHVQ